MISGAALAAWRASSSEQAETAALAERLAARWRTHRLIADLEADLAAMPVKTGQSVLAAAERFIARRDEITQLIHEMLAAAAADPFFRPPFLVIATDINAGFLLYGDPHLTITIGTTAADALAAKKSGVRGPTSIGFTGLLTSFHWLQAGGATLSFWEAPATSADFQGSSDARCRFTHRRTLADGDSFVMDGRYQSFVIEHATSDMICLQAAVHADCAPLSVEYDSRTLAYAGATSTDEASSRTEMMVSLLRVLDRGDAVPDLVGLLDGPHFHTRWHVMREFLAINADAALPHLRRMAESDPHPEVRSAAAQTLDMFFGEEEAA